jgi:hypothetical protein
MRRLAPILALLAVLVLPAGASAAFGVKPGTEGLDVTVLKKDGSPENRAGAHPHAMNVSIRMNTSGGLSDGDLRDAHLSLPAGLMINLAPVDECSPAAFHTPRVSPHEASLSGESCPATSQIGVVAVKSSHGGGSTRYFGVFAVEAPFGEPLTIGFAPFGRQILISSHLRDADAGLSLDLENLSQAVDLQSLELTLWGTPWADAHDIRRGNCLNGVTGGSYGSCSTERHVSFVKSILTLPTFCEGPPTYTLQLRSWKGEEAGATVLGHNNAGQPLPTEECKNALTKAHVRLTGNEAATGSGLVFDLEVEDGGGILNEEGIARPAIRTAVVALPPGMTLNPALGAGLGVCAAAEFDRETPFSLPGAGCPNSSKIGRVEAEGLMGLDDAVVGSLFLSRPYDNPFGSRLGVYMVASSARRGVAVKSVGKVDLDPASGQVTVTFEDLPRLLYTHFSLRFREGNRSAFVSPPTCGTFATQIDTRSWGRPDVLLRDVATFSIARGQRGGQCPVGAPPFQPGANAGSLNPQAGAYSPLLLNLLRSDADQEITSYSATLPPGLLGKIAGIPFCPDAAIAAATTKSGLEELRSPSCPAASSIGRTETGYGVGKILAYAPGGFYLAGPHKGSPLSVVAIDSAVVGPFDLGVVVVRSAIDVDPRTAQVTIDSSDSDPIPHILDGVPLHLRDIRVYVERPGMTVNPTSCERFSIVSTLTGSSAPFVNPRGAVGQATVPYQAFNCSSLGFAPAFTLDLSGGHKRGAHPQLKATLAARPGDANVKSAAVTLPPSIFFAQENIRGVCPRAQALDACPPGSVIGHAKAETPLVDEPFEGPVYLRSSTNTLPDLVAVLNGRGVRIVLEGRVDAHRGGIRARFEGLPDAPVNRFTMTIFGGRKRGLLVNSDNLCRGRHRAEARFLAQNNATAILRPQLRLRCRKGAKGGKGRKGGKARSSGGRAKASEVTQKGRLRVKVDAEVSPQVLPREGLAPVSMSLTGKISAANGSPPPPLRGFQIAINSSGRLETAGLPVCHLKDIQPATTARALEACGKAKVGTGVFEADVSLPEQSPFPSVGRLTAFNGVENGKPAIFAHVYGTEPIPTSFTLPLRVSQAKGQFGTVLTASLPDVTSDVASITGISLKLGRQYVHRGKRHSYLSAGCPAPEGFPGAVYPLVRTSFSFEGGPTLRQTLNRNCRVR